MLTWAKNSIQTSPPTCLSRLASDFQSTLHLSSITSRAEGQFASIKAIDAAENTVHNNIKESKGYESHCI